MNKNCQSSQKYRRIWTAVKNIPYGKVATYGQIADVAGLEGQARLVGYALHAKPKTLRIPWHRVINSLGKISLPKEGGQYFLQQALLKKEGIEFIQDKVNLKKYQWQTDKIIISI